MKRKALRLPQKTDIDGVGCDMLCVAINIAANLFVNQYPLISHFFILFIFDTVYTEYKQADVYRKCVLLQICHCIPHATVK